MLKRSFLCFVLLIPISLQAAEHLKARTFKEPLREFSIIVSDDGYYPNKLVAFKGERIRFFVTSTTAVNSCFMLKKHKVFLAAQKGKISEAETLLEESGTFSFYCPATNFSGELTVLDKEVKKEEVKNKREVASEKPTYWTPRNYD